MLDRWLKPVARPGASAKAVRRRASSSDDEIDAADPGPPAKGPRLEIGTSAVGVADEPVAKEAPPHPVPSARQPLPLGVVRSASLPPVTKTYASRRTRHTPPGLISESSGDASDGTPRPRGDPRPVDEARAAGLEGPSTTAIVEAIAKTSERGGPPSWILADSAMVTFDATLWAPRSSPGPTPRRAPAWEQTCLNLGQRGTHLAACAECGMRYNPAGAEDRRLHTRHHRTVLAQPVWRAPSGAARGGGPRVVWDHRVCAPPAAAAAAAPLGGRVIQLAAGSPRVWRQRAARLLDAMASHLNAGQAAADDLAPAPTPAPTVGGALATLWARGDGRAQQHQMYVYLDDHDRVCGAVWVTSAVRGWQRHGVPRDSRDAAPPRLDALPSPELGVEMIWTHPSCRRHGVAQTLVTSAAQFFHAGHAVAPRAIAFSQPTLAGHALAMALTGLASYWVYPGSTL